MKLRNILLRSLLVVSSCQFEDHKSHDSHSQHEEHEEHDDHGHGDSKAIGQGKAIENVDEVQGFKLSKEAVSTLKLALKSMSTNTLSIGKNSIVISKSNKGIYRYRSGFFKFIPVQIIKELENGYLIKVETFEFGDQMVVQGVDLLRVSDVYSTDKSEYGHSH